MQLLLAMGDGYFNLRAICAAVDCDTTWNVRANDCLTLPHHQFENSNPRVHVQDHEIR